MLVSDVAVGQRLLQAGQIVEGDDPRRERGIHGRSHVARGGDHPPVLQRCEGLIHRAVVVPVVHDHLGAASQLACQPQHEPVRVRRRQAELPEAQTEAPAHLVTDPDRVLGGQHEGEALRRPLGDRVHRHLRPMARHGAGVAQAQIHVLDAVHVGEPGAVRLRHPDRERTRPPGHPVHGHAVQEGAFGLLEQVGGARVGIQEAAPLTVHEIGETGTVDRRHGASCSCRRDRACVRASLARGASPGAD